MGLINFQLPPEIWSEILSYLPVKSLVRFRSVSKKWKSIIENPGFASFHLNHYSNNRLESQLFTLGYPERGGEPRARLCSRGTYEAEYNPQVLEYDIPIPDCIVDRLSVSDHWPEIVGDVNGLLLVEANVLFEVFLWNPSIRKTLNISVPPSPGNITELFLGFDPSTNDYKVVNIYVHYYEDREPAFFNIFSLKSPSWRRKNFSASGGKKSLPNWLETRNITSRGSSVHWIDYDFYGGTHEIANFNMTSETFSYTLLPEFDPQKFGKPVLMTGFLEGFLVKCEDFIEIWVLKKDDCSWSKRYKFDISLLDYDITWSGPSIPSYFTKDGAYIWGFYDFEAGHSGICSYETSKGVKSVVTISSHWHPPYIGTYMESLVLLAEDN